MKSKQKISFLGGALLSLTFLVSCTTSADSSNISTSGNSTENETMTQQSTISFQSRTQTHAS